MANKNPLVSVVIITYNRKEFLKKIIGGIVDSSFNNYEIIIIDDGSTDNTKMAISTEIQKFDIRYIYQSNKGVSAARNKGVKTSIGKFIVFIDSDILCTKPPNR